MWHSGQLQPSDFLASSLVGALCVCVCVLLQPCTTACRDIPAAASPRRAPPPLTRAHRTGIHHTEDTHRHTRQTRPSPLPQHAGGDHLQPRRSNRRSRCGPGLQCGTPAARVAAGNCICPMFASWTTKRLSGPRSMPPTTPPPTKAAAPSAPKEGPPVGRLDALLRSQSVSRGGRQSI